MDNPDKKKADGKRISKQSHEQAYQKRRVAKKSAVKRSASKSKKA